MRKLSRIAVVFVILLLCATGCSKRETIVGTWRDSDGYTVEFKDDGTLIETNFGQPMKYSFDGANILYYGADGLPRFVPVHFKFNGHIVFRMAGKDREFSETDKPVICFSWEGSDVSMQETVQAKYKLLGDTGVQSELRLLSNGQYSLTYTQDSAPINTWNIMGPGVDVGTFAASLSDVPDADNNLILYKRDKTCTEVFKQSETGKYLAAMPLQGEATSISQDFTSPISWRGYSISSIFSDELEDIVYHFKDDNTMIKELSDGTQINYAYFISPEGLVTLSCLDGILPKDSMYLDLNTRCMYRLVFERDSWADFLYQISDENQQLVSADNLSTAPQETKVQMLKSSYGRVVDADYVVDFYNSTDNLLFPYEPGDSDFMSLVQTSDSYKATLNYVLLCDQRAKAIESEVERDQLEKQKEQEKQEFLEWMAELIQQKKELEEERATHTGDFAEDILKEYEYLFQTPGLDDTGSNTEVQQPEEPKKVETSPPTDTSKPVDETSSTASKVQFFCNCETCHTQDTPVPRGADAVALADASKYTPGDNLLVGDDNAVEVRVMDSNGTVVGDRLDLYFTDHDWVMQQLDGQYSIRRVLG